MSPRFVGRGLSALNNYGHALLRVMWQLNGTATVLYPGYYRFVSGGIAQAGTMWSINTFAMPLTISCTVYQPTFGGDGYCIAVESDTSPDTNIGGSGGQEGLAGAPYQSWGISFDNFNNSGQPGPMPLIAPFDSTNLTGYENVFAYYDYYLTSSSNIQGTHNVIVKFSSHYVDIWYDGIHVLGSASNMSSLPSGNVRVGFSAATGSAINSVYISNIKVM